MKAYQGTEVTGQLHASAVLTPGKGKESLAPVEGARWILPVAWSLYQLSYPSPVEVINTVKSSMSEHAARGAWSWLRMSRCQDFYIHALPMSL